MGITMKTIKNNIRPGLVVDKLDDVKEEAKGLSVPENKSTKGEKSNSTWDRRIPNTINPETGLYFLPEGQYWKIVKSGSSYDIYLKLKTKGLRLDKTLGWHVSKTNRRDQILEAAAYILYTRQAAQKAEEAEKKLIEDAKKLEKQGKVAFFEAKKY
jgi:hypothetical protein